MKKCRDKYEYWLVFVGFECRIVFYSRNWQVHLFCLQTHFILIFFEAICKSLWLWFRKMMRWRDSFANKNVLFWEIMLKQWLLSGFIWCTLVMFNHLKPPSDSCHTMEHDLLSCLGKNQWFTWWEWQTSILFLNLLYN